MRKQVKLSSVQNVVAGGRATVNLPVGLTYQLLKFALTNISLAQMQNIEVEVNGKVIQTYADGTELDALNKYEGLPAFANGILTLHFAKRSMFSLADQRITALGTSNVNTLTVSFDIDAGVTNPAVEVWATQTKPEPLNMIRKVKRFPLSMGAGLNEIDSLPRGGARIQRIHLKKSDIEHVSIEVDSVKVFDQTDAIITSTQVDYGRTKQSGYTHLDFTLEGQIAQALSTTKVVNGKPVGVQDFRVLPTCIASGNLVAIVEYLDGIGGI